MIRVIALVLLAEIFFAAGNVLFKKTANQLETPSFKKSHRTYFVFIQSVLGVPAVWLGMGSMAIAIVIWIMALAQSDLSLVFALGSMQYLLILFVSRFFLGEPMDRTRVLGTCFIAAGISLVALSRP